MSLTGLPSKPPLALTSSSQIFWASSADLPLAARPPVIAMLKPILIGWPDCAAAPPARGPNATATTAAATADLSVESMWFPPIGLLLASCWRHIRAIAKPRARGVPIGQSPRPPSFLGGVAAFHHEGLDLAGAVAAERRGF